MASSSTTAAASIGMMPTIERTFTGTSGPVRGDEPVVEEAVDVVPQPLGVHGVPDGGEVLDELEDEVCRPAAGPAGCSTTAMAAIDRA